MQDTVRRILTARVYDVAEETPLDPLKRLSARLDRAALLKREDLQPVFSFKIRGAYNRIANLTEAELARGVICASAGNHAQGVALAAARRGAASTIVMPTTTPGIKVAAVKALGGNVVLHGDSFDDAYAHARALEQETGAAFVHPFDDPDVIAGQGTVGLEILRQHPDPIDAVFVPIGGGGLAAGVAAIVRFLRPETKIIGVEPADAPTMKSAIAAGHVVTLDQVGLFADGVAVRRAGDETFRLCRDLLDDIVLVDTDAICAAVKDIFDDVRAVAEPSGAVALAGMKVWAARHPGVGALVAINSGANVNFDRLRHVAERAEIGEGAEALLAVAMPDRRDDYHRFLQSLDGRSVTEFNYRWSGDGTAQIFVGVSLKGGGALKQPNAAREAIGQEKETLIERLRSDGYAVEDMSDNETAKLHVRYMVGGRTIGLPHERLLRFEFPERPGAFLRFLNSLQPAWALTLFHYRNHGDDVGRVLAGISVAPDQVAALWTALDALGYPYVDETDNPACRLFLDGAA
ncbi:MULTISPECIES: threonine ammonia-lyase, biosynthetic [unclassified Brevundimonas]|uniref:threonine ammonia-lyase, biosynthetic n=1 Tax=unclassified Brevundimonas TaxID=2622653 RepID=UPI000CFA964C|nr:MULTISPECIES: threonine ammonia-lyase, biosynthetic [unclassified Brevundimonas]PRA29578.1 threonine ammonia-lyase, biosynthetic [Brevundimonas sp. MYb27]PQZ75351.1 threonine ammonia-lyase, biosynthetic [Brevundimonas sp. MYb31]PRB15715.1 threonine ammonia-lyase, biosynthetic [Brevundimonas sp. MYb52]PRB33189.1 threonine ammonia-lyase, biosynthetic [Brevundimonas sp. MYb46]PRB43660.1 threonine ammonia-lyase, biosynthetic [Brevundimonas sp. MYb33]